MRKPVIALCLAGAIALEGHAQTIAPSHLLVCSNGVCILVPAPSGQTPPAGPQAPQQAMPQVLPPAVSAVHAPKASHAKAIVLTAAVSAVGTWVLVKVFKRKSERK